MARTPRFPNYPSRPHGRSAQARIRLPGQRNHSYLGRHGSPESWAEYNRLLTEWRAAQGGSNTQRVMQYDSAPVRLVRDLIARYLLWGQQHYTDADGTVRDELRNVRFALAPLLELHGHTPLQDFGPRALGSLLRAATAKHGWSRRYANATLARWKGVWRWAESEELVPHGTYHALRTVRGLQPGQARERDEVPPVPEEDFRATLPQLRPVVREAVELLALTGARPSELLRLVPADIDRGGVVELARGYRVQLPAGVWCVQPAKHKTARKGKRRVILLGPQAQALLLPLLEGLGEHEPIFSPRRARTRRLEWLRARRKTKVQPSQVSRSSPGARQPSEQYTVTALRQAIERACVRAGVPRFSPYQIRHLAATKLNAEFGPEVARLVLGHEDLKMLQVYALGDIAKAAEAMKQTG